MKKLFPILYSTLFFAVCLFFAAGAVFFPPDTDAEGRALTPAPSLFAEGKLNASFFTEFDTYLSERFTLRQSLVSLDSRVKETVFQTGSDQVIVGRDGFLFYSETAPDYTGDSRMTPEEIDAAADALLLLSDYAAAHGAKLLVAVAPNKSTVYPDKMPGAYPPDAGVSNYTALLDALRIRNVSAVDLRPTLSGRETRTYHLADTHWNGYGAALAHDAILTDLTDTPHEDSPGLSFTSYGKLPLIEKEGFASDLSGMLYPGAGETEADILPDFDFSQSFIYTSATSAPMDMVLATRGAGTGRYLIFRDSFGSAIIPYFSASAEEVRYERAVPYRIDLLEQYKADTVIVMIAERNIPTLLTAADRLKETDG